MNSGNALFVRMIICALLAIGAWNLGIIASRTFITNEPYTFDLILNGFIPMVLGCFIGYMWKPKS